MYTAPYLSILERIQNASRLIDGEIGSGPGFSGEPRLRVALAFPEVYEIGISNEAIQILYYLARTVPGVDVERVYLPWIDASSLLRYEKVPLLTLETWTPVAEAHLLGITLQHELNYTNVLELLELSGIPVRASERSTFPLVIAGGPAVANFAPMAPFLDAIVVGEGEEVFPEILATLVRNIVEEGGGRDEALASLAAVRGVFVPGLSRGVERRVLPRLEGAPYPDQPLVSAKAGVHDRAWIEVMRGCTRGCRFCQAGMWYRPVRERRASSVLALAEDQVASTGHEELALSSLSTTDYSALPDLLRALALRLPEVRVVLPSLRVDSAAVRLCELTSRRASSITLAPEAGSQRLRDVINKNVDEEDVLEAAREAFSQGYTTLKLYFMIGLPTETADDVQGIVELCRRIAGVGKSALGARAGRLALNVSVTNFIPKPFTPFQWEPMASRAELEQRQRILRRGLRRGPFKLSLHSLDTSYLEAALARGGAEMADVIEEAWRRGARFDCWTDQERLDAWAAAFGSNGLAAEELATRVLGEGDALPWDLIEGPVVSKEFLLGERWHAYRGLATPDCRQGECLKCGVCGKELKGPDLAREAGGLSVGPAPSVDSPSSGHPARQSEMNRSAGAASLRYLLEFSVTGRMRFLAHLDTVEVLRRAVRRAGGRLAWSQGMRPRSELSCVVPRPVGVESRVELCQVGLSEPPPSGFVSSLNAVLPEGITVGRMIRWMARRPAASYVTSCTYEVWVTGEASGSGAPEFQEAVRAAAHAFAELDVCYVTRRRPPEARQVDVKQFVQCVQVGSLPEIEGPGGDAGTCLRFQTRITPRGAARPEDVVEAISTLACLALHVRRVERTAIGLSVGLDRWTERNETTSHHE